MIKSNHKMNLRSSTLKDHPYSRKTLDRRCFNRSFGRNITKHTLLDLAQNYSKHNEVDQLVRKNPALNKAFSVPVVECFLAGATPDDIPEKYRLLVLSAINYENSEPQDIAAIENLIQHGSQFAAWPGDKGLATEIFKNTCYIHNRRVETLFYNMNNNLSLKDESVLKYLIDQMAELPDDKLSLLKDLSKLKRLIIDSPKPDGGYQYVSKCDWTDPAAYQVLLSQIDHVDAEFVTNCMENVYLESTRAKQNAMTLLQKGEGLSYSSEFPSGCPLVKFLLKPGVDQYLARLSLYKAMRSGPIILDNWPRKALSNRTVVEALLAADLFGHWMSGKSHVSGECYQMLYELDGDRRGPRSLQAQCIRKIIYSLKDLNWVSLASTPLPLRLIKFIAEEAGISEQVKI